MNESRGLDKARSAKRTRNNPFHEASYNWRGGRRITQGYVQLMIYPDNPYYHMGKATLGLGRRILEHRLVMALHIGRPLLQAEHVHHKNGIRDDNRIENLDLMPNPGTHSKLMICSRCELRKEIRLLRLQIRELSAALQLKLQVEEGIA